jgi:cbb3-type cytochrome oxidase subunit 1
MSKLVRRYLRTAIVFLVAGLVLGLAISAAEHLELGPLRPPWIVAHTHLLLVGFVMMMILGVALWMFPKPAAQDSRYRPERMELVYWLVLAGVVIRTGSEVLLGFADETALHAGAFAGSALEVLGIVLFFWNLLPRIRSPREELAKRGES